MVTYCAVFGCNSNAKQNKDLLFHTFPKDEETRKKWVNACKRADKFNADNGRICSLHFEKSAYARNLKYELLRLPLPRMM